MPKSRGGRNARTPLLIHNAKPAMRDPQSPAPRFALFDIDVPNRPAVT